MRLRIALPASDCRSVAGPPRSLFPIGRRTRAIRLKSAKGAARSAELWKEQIAPRSVLREFNKSQAGVAASGAAIGYGMMKGGRR